MVNKSQLFCKDISYKILFTLLDKVTSPSIINDDISNDIIKFYKIDKIIFKKLEYHNLLESFFNSLKEYYYANKQFYTEREKKYNNFLTIVRQICKYNNVVFKKEIIYEKDSYTIEYYIYI